MKISKQFSLNDNISANEFPLVQKYILNNILASEIKKQYENTGIIETINSDTLYFDNKVPKKLKFIAQVYIKYHHLYSAGYKGEEVYRVEEIRYLTKANGHTKEFIETPLGRLTISSEPSNIRLFDATYIDNDCVNSMNFREVHEKYESSIKYNSPFAIINEAIVKTANKFINPDWNRLYHWESCSIPINIDLRALISKHEKRVGQYVGKVSNTIVTGKGLNNNTVASEQTLAQVRKKINSIKYETGINRVFVVAGSYNERVYFAAHKAGFDSRTQDRFNLVESITPNVPIFETYWDARNEIEKLRNNSGKIEYNKIFWVIKYIN